MVHHRSIDPSSSPPTAANTGCVCVFAKRPKPGAVKTRLAVDVGYESAADLARAFLADTIESLARVAWARPILAVAELSGPAFDCPPQVTVWHQGDGDLGQRIERVLRRAIRLEPFAMAVGADTPGLPSRIFEHARSALDRADAVLGPTADGGFYLLGVNRLPVGVLAGLPWGTSETFESTVARLEDRGLTVEILEPWFDVDRLPDLRRLAAMIAAGEISACATARALALLAEDQRETTP